MNIETDDLTPLVWSPKNASLLSRSIDYCVERLPVPRDSAAASDAANRYAADGYLLLADMIPSAAIEELEDHLVALLESWTGKRFGTLHDAALAEYFLGNRELERRLYDGIRLFPWLKEFSLSPAITQGVTALLGDRVGLMEKIVFRIDLPGVTRELAVWHQDFFYVKGNEQIVTAWIPLQDTAYENGCLMVMPGSSRLGPLDHDRKILGKRHFPSNIFERDVRYVPMKRGDLLFFNALMLHSSGVNISDRVRFSVQARYSPLDLPTDPGMGRLIPIDGME